MPDTPQWIPQTDAEMKAYLDSALPLEDACLLTLLASDEPVTGQRLFRQEDLLSPPLHAVTLVWIDIQTMPEFADLSRVHRTEGDGEPLLTWVYWNEHWPTSIFALEVQLTAPVRASFHVPFRVKERQGLLAGIAKYGCIRFVPGPPLDYHAMMRTMDQAALIKTIDEKCGKGIEIHLPPDLCAEVKLHLDAWKQRFPHLS